MKYISPIALWACFLASGQPIASAQGLIEPPKSVKRTDQTYTLPPGLTEEMLAPPPVPSFMLKKPATPLSIEEMLQQAREAEKSVKTTKPVPANK